MLTKVDYTLPSGDRALKRSDLIEAMLEELPGTGKGEDCSRYEYVVEHFGSYEIYLKRPTQLNKGFDFTVNIRELYFKTGERRRANPSYQDIFDALSSCKLQNPKEYGKVSTIITSLYNCEDVDFSTPLNISFRDFEGAEHPIEIILLAIKWLFMEQDCAYWNHSGRAKLYSGLKEQGLA